MCDHPLKLPLQLSLGFPEYYVHQNHYPNVQHSHLSGGSLQWVQSSAGPSPAFPTATKSYSSPYAQPGTGYYQHACMIVSMLQGLVLFAYTVHTNMTKKWAKAKSSGELLFVYSEI